MGVSGRNDACPCGSGKKYKKCCLGKADATMPKGDAQNSQLELNEAIHSALVHQQAGRLQQATEIYQKVLQIQPKNPDALHLLGLIAHQAGQLKAALDLINQAIQISPYTPLYYSNIGLVLSDLGHSDKALACYQKAIELQPDFVDAFNHIGTLLEQRGQIDEAIAQHQKAIRIKPNHAEAHFNLGNALWKQGRGEEALASYRMALLHKPAFPDVFNNIGLVLAEMGREEEALPNYHHALALRPDYAVAHNNLGSALNALGRYDEAREHLLRAQQLNPGYAEAYNNMGNLERDTGQLQASIDQYQKALSLRPSFAEVYSNLGCVFTDLERRNEAMESYRKAIELAPDNPLTYNNIAVLYREVGKYSEAIEYSWKALALKPDFADPYITLGNALAPMGRSVDAISAFREALKLNPRHAGAYSNLLFTMLYEGSVSPAELFAESCRFGETFEAPFIGSWPRHANSCDPGRRLKIGYVSGDFRNHAVAYFIDPILASHDKDGFEVYCYANHPLQDATTARLRGLADHWFQCFRMSDEQLSARIQADSIDILIDLSGHTAYNRLPVFARKPAPLQVTWIGYCGTTGLKAMDYRLTDACCDPPGMTDAFFTEKLVRLSATAAFRPDVDAPPVNRLPALEGNPFTFASLNNPSKLNENVIALWARILKAVPSARMMLGNAQAKQEQWLVELFARYGVGAERLQLQPRLSMQEYLALHNHIDLALDTFPYNGGTTSSHALWMGVPVVTLAGDRSVSRVGAAIMSTAGLPQFVVEDEDSYVECAVQTVHELEKLDALRQGLRAHILSRQVSDPVAVTREIETAFRAMWQRWCAGLPADSFEVACEKTTNAIAGGEK